MFFISLTDYLFGPFTRLLEPDVGDGDGGDVFSPRSIVDNATSFGLALLETYAGELVDRGSPGWSEAKAVEFGTAVHDAAAGLLSPTALFGLGGLDFVDLPAAFGELARVSEDQRIEAALHETRAMEDAARAWTDQWAWTAGSAGIMPEPWAAAAFDPVMNAIAEARARENDVIAANIVAAETSFSQTATATYTSDPIPSEPWRGT